MTGAETKAVSAVPRRIALIYDDSLRPETTGHYVRRALEAQSIEVIHLRPGELRTREITNDFDLFLNVDDGMRYLLPPELAPTAYWAIDTHVDYDWQLHKAGFFDFVFVAQHDGVARLRTDGVRNAHWLPLACDPQMHGRIGDEESPKGKHFDWSFVGNVHSAERERLLQLLRARWPNHFVGNAYFEEMARTYARSRIVFNRSIANDLNMRVFEALASGSLLVTNRLDGAMGREGDGETGAHGDNGQLELFEDGVHLVTYSSDEELIERFAYYMAHEAERERIAAAGCQHVLAHHTYAHRVQTLLEFVATQPPERTWNTKVAGKRRLYFQHARPELVALVPENACRILDVGCGAGRLGEALKRRDAGTGGCIEVVGIELNAEIAEAARQRLDAVHVGDVETMELPYASGHFDCIVCGDVLEHLRDPRAALNRLVELLAKEGSLVASIPNVRNLHVIGRLLDGLWTYEEAGILDADHVRFFTLREIRKLFESCGLVVETSQAVCDPEHGNWVAAGRPTTLRIGRATLELGSVEEAEEFFAEQWLVRARPNDAVQPVSADSSPLTSHHSPGLVSIVIPCWNQVEYTWQCVASLREHASYDCEWIFVNNGSTDETGEFLQSIQDDWKAGQLPSSIRRVEIIGNETNQGFARACNQGIAAARGDFVLLLNNDVVVTESWLDRLVGLLTCQPQLGAVGPCTNKISGPQQVPVNYAASDLDGMQDFARRVGVERRGQWFNLDRLVGFCLLVKGSALRRIGLLDEQFELGSFEDDDLCLRLLEAGYQLAVAADCFVHHFGSQTLLQLGETGASDLYERNRNRFTAKWQNSLLARRTYGSLFQESDSGGTSTQATTVSLCMIVKNEEANLPECLRSVGGLFDEIVIVDTGSSDRTREVAAGFPKVKLAEFPWIDDFSAARNVSLAQATSDWVMWLDADDRLDPENRQKLRGLFASLPPPARALTRTRAHPLGYVMKVLCLPDADGGYTAVDHVKLFPRHERLRFEYRVHEQILPALRQLGGDVCFTDIVIRHTGYQDKEQRKRKLERDRRILEAELQERPEDPFCLFNLGCIAFEAGDFSAVCQLMRRSIDLSNPTDSTVRKCYAMLAHAHRNQGDLTTALAVCREGLRAAPDDLELLFHEGLTHHQMGALTEAESCLVRLLSIADRPDSHFSSIDLGIRSYTTRHNLAVVYTEQGKDAEAEIQWRRAISEEPSFLAARLGLGELLLKQQRYREARAHVEQSIALLPEAMPLRVLLSHVLLQAHDDLPAAESALKDVLARDGANAEAHHNLGALYHELGRKDEALPHLKRAAELRPEHAMTQSLLDLVNRDQGRLD